MKIRSVLGLIVVGLSILPMRWADARSYDWIETASTVLVDAYQYPFAPELEFDAEAIAAVMQSMHVNTVRMSTMGKYATIQGVRFSTHPDQGNRDLLQEMIAACRPRGIRVVPYISTGHKLAWSMVTEEFPEYAHQVSPGGPPDRQHMFVGEDHGTVCWNTPYRKAYMDLVEHVVADYDIDGIYFDTWRPFSIFPEPRTCYCAGCREGFREASGLEIPYQADLADYSREERLVIEKYHGWYREQLAGIVSEVRAIVKKHKDIPLIYNINNPEKIMREDPRIIEAMDAFLYERGHSMLERAEGVSLARAAGLAVWPYVGSYDNWPRSIHNGVDFGQEILVTAMFGGGPIISQPVAFLEDAASRPIVAEPFRLLEEHSTFFKGFQNYPFVAVVYASEDPPGHAQKNWWWKADVRSSSLGAFAACLYRHIQVSSVLETLLDDPSKMSSYRVLYLADVPYLSPERIENLKRFVEQGGGLLISYSTSLFGADGSRRERFALEELIRVRPREQVGELEQWMYKYSAMVGGPNDLYLTMREGVDPELAGWRSRLVPLWFYEPVSALEGGEVVADIVTGDGRRPVLPAIVVSKHGRGRVAYLASSLESLYLGSNIKELADLVSTLIQWVAPEPLPFELQGPEGVIANMTQKGDTRVVHLSNWTGNKFERRWLAEYYIAPVSDLQLRIPVAEGARVDVRQLAKGRIETNRSPGTLEILIPKMGAYQGIAVQVE